MCRVTQPYPPRQQPPGQWGQQPGWPAQQVQPGWNQPQQGFGQPNWQQQPGGFRAPTQAGYPQRPQQGYPQPPQGGYGPPQRGGNPLGRILIMLVAVCGVLLVGVVVANMMSGRTPGADPRPTETYTPPPPDMNPPEIPQPKTYGEATEWLENNPFYQQRIVIPTDCNNMQPVDAVNASETELNAHLQLLTACLLKVWNAPIEAAGFVMPRPPATVYSQPIKTACGTLDDLRNASYCGGDQRIYYGMKLPSVFPPELRNTKFLMEMVLGHEFGHAIQYRTGIGVATLAWEQRVTSKAEANVFSRRLEMQADCFAGMWVSAVAPSQGLSGADLDALKTIAYNLGDDILSGRPDIDSGHGSGKNRQKWFTTGLTGGPVIGQCNTYVAPKSEVR